jgi:hypothetical protein
MYDDSSAQSTQATSATGAISFGNVVIPTGAGGGSGALGSLSTWLAVGVAALVVWFVFLKKK